MRRTISKASESIGEVLAGRKAQLQRDLGDRLVGIAEKLFCFFDAREDQITMGADADLLTKAGRESARRELAEFCQVVDFPVFFGLLVQYAPCFEDGGVILEQGFFLGVRA